MLDRAIEMEHSDRFKIALFNWFDYIDDTLFLKESRSHAGGRRGRACQPIDWSYPARPGRSIRSPRLA